MARTLSPKTIRNAWGLVRSAVDAFSQMHIALPAPVPPRLSIPQDAQVQTLLAESRKDPQLHAAILLSALGGLRRSEICALTPEDIDLDACTVSVNKAKVLDASRILVTKAPKSYAGTRIVHYPKDALNLVLKAHLTDSETLLAITPDIITKRFYRLCRRLNMEFRFHDLRHYTASILLALGVPDKYAMEIMGHATNATLKQIYQHTMDEKRKEVADRMTAYFSSFQAD